MPQLTISPYDVAASIRVSVQLNVDKPGGSIVAVIEDERGLPLARAHKRWRSERDLASMDRCIGDIVNHFMWGIPDRLELALAMAIRDWLPPAMPALNAHRRRRDAQKGDR